MMGTKENMKGGDEYSFLTKARRWYIHRAGEIKKVKRRFWKRVRKNWKTETRQEMANKDNHIAHTHII